MRAGNDPGPGWARWPLAVTVALTLVMALGSGCAGTTSSQPGSVAPADATTPMPADAGTARPRTHAGLAHPHRPHHGQAHAPHATRPRHPGRKHPHARRSVPRSVAHRPTPTGVPRKDMPNPALTPGVVLTTSTLKVCTPGYSSSVRDVPTSVSDAVYARYHVVHTPYAHEVDHLVSLELGGSNAISNLWPEPYAGGWGARTKDVLENRLHGLVCSGALSLPHAQHLEATNWVTAYRRFVGHPPSAHSTHPQPKPQPAHAAAGSCEPGYSPCLPVTSDLDCADIPDGKKPIHVTGSDPYRLDADGDGLGCE